MSDGMLLLKGSGSVVHSLTAPRMVYVCLADALCCVYLLVVIMINYCRVCAY